MAKASFAAWPRAARRKAGLTQTRLAEEIVVRPLTVSRWESGKQTPSVSRQRQLRQMLDGGADTEKVSEEPAPYGDTSTLVRLSPEELQIVRIYRRLMGQSPESG